MRHAAQTRLCPCPSPDLSLWMCLRQPQQCLFLEQANSLKSGKTGLAFPAWEGNKSLDCCPSSRPDILPAFLPQTQRARPIVYGSRHQMTPMICKGILMAANTWGPRICGPHCSWWLWRPQKGQEKLALDLAK